LVVNSKLLTFTVLNNETNKKMENLGKMLIQFPNSTRFCDVIDILKFMQQGLSFEDSFKNVLQGFGEALDEYKSTEYQSLSHTAWEMGVAEQGVYI